MLQETLGFAIHGVEAKYYADGENAFDMRHPLERAAYVFCNIRGFPGRKLGM